MAIKRKTKSETFNSFSSKVENNKAKLKRVFLHIKANTHVRFYGALQSEKASRMERGMLFFVIVVDSIAFLISCNLFHPFLPFDIVSEDKFFPARLILITTARVIY